MKNNFKNRFATMLSMVLVVAMACVFTACGTKTEDAASVEESSQVTESVEESVEAQESSEEEATEEASEEVAEEAPSTLEETTEESSVEESAEKTVLGEGAVVFDFVVVDAEGNEKNFEIHTDKATVGEALVELGLVEGDDSEYGLYVKTVDGVTADYDVDQTYWAFYINGEYAQTGVDATNVEEGATYSFKIEK